MKKVFYGWYVTIACGIGLACGLASVVVNTFPIFLGPLRQEFGWAQTEVYFAIFLTTMTVTLAAPFFGALVDRVGARRIILIGLFLEAAVIASFATQTDSLTTFYIRYVTLAVLGLGSTHIAFTRIISVWFDRRRGLALGIALAGLGLGGFFWPLLSQLSIDAFGWRNAYMVVGATIVAVGMTAIALVVRDSPQAMGLLPDGAAPAPDAGRKPVSMPGLTMREALGTGVFWIMFAAFLLIGFGLTSIQLHLVPLLTGRGVSPMLAATAQAIMAIALLVGRVGAGFLMDRFFAPRVAIAFLLGPLIAIVLLAMGASGPAAFVAGILTGLAAGAEVDVTAYLASRYFGVRYFSSIYAWYFSAYSLGAGIGPLVTANAVDRFGGYTEVLILHAALLAGAGVLLTRLKAFPDWGRAGH